MIVMGLEDKWDLIAKSSKEDSMRPTRYGKCLRYLDKCDKNSAIIDIGCGEGSGLMLAKHLGFSNLTGLEVSIEQLISTKKKLGNGVNYIYAGTDIKYPVKNNSVDIVLSLSVIEHTINQETFVKEIQRIVKPGGIVIISSDCYNWRILQKLGKFKSNQPIDCAPSPFTLKRYFDRYGLEILHCEGFPHPRIKYRFLRLLIRPFDYFLFSKINESCDERNEFNDAFNHINTSISKTNWLFSIPKLIFSDEDIFLLRKRR
jgi:SAM-dependent methyltransferase